MAVIAVMSPALRNALAYGTAAEAIVPAGVLLASCATVLLFLLVLKAFVLDDTAPTRPAKRVVAAALLRLANLLTRAATAFMSWVAQSGPLRPFRVEPLNLRLNLHQVVKGPSPCWPQGHHPHTTYA